MKRKTPPSYADFCALTAVNFRAAPAPAPRETPNAISRRKFFGLAGAVGATLALASTAGRATAGAARGADAESDRVPGSVAIPGTIAMGSGAPLGGIGTGFLEIRPDGCFHEWQILNQGAWSAHRRRGQAEASAGTPPNLRFLLRTGRPGGPPQLRRLYLRNDENDL